MSSHNPSSLPNLEAENRRLKTENQRLKTSLSRNKRVLSDDAIDGIAITVLIFAIVTGVCIWLASL